MLSCLTFKVRQVRQIWGRPATDRAVSQLWKWDNGGSETEVRQPLTWAFTLLSHLSYFFTYIQIYKKYIYVRHPPYVSRDVLEKRGESK